MLDIAGWIITVNIIIICFTVFRCFAMKYNYLDDCLRWEKEHASLQATAEEAD